MSVIGEKQRLNQEKMVLNHLNMALENNSFCSPQELKQLLLNPKMVGEVSLYSPDKNIVEFFMGISYLPLHQRSDVHGANIEGIIIDRMGVGLIKGIQSEIDGYKGLKFSRQNINYDGVSKNTPLVYECSTEEDMTLYEGAIIGAARGTFNLYQNNESKYKIHYVLAEYFDKFVKGPKLDS